MAELYPADVVARFWPKVDRRASEECWEWVGGTRNAKGYGVFSVAGRTKQAHRVAYELTSGPIPPRLTIDHRCHNKGCANPAHLEVVTRAENSRRGNAVRAYATKSHCKRGHELAGSNVYFDNRGQRSCHQCRIDRGRASRRGIKLP